MIICVTGPTGAGKTATSWALIEIGAPMVFLDCDWFASRIPFSWSSESDVESVFQAIAVMLGFHVKRGVIRFVVPVTVEMALSFQHNRHYFEKVRLPVFAFQLWCREEQLRQRISGRDRIPEQKAAELAAIHNQQVQCAGLSPEFQIVDTSNLGEHAVARKIWSAVSRVEQSTT